MRALIIDDETKARSLLEALIQQNCPQISEIVMAEDLPSGVKQIKKFNPDLVFLDIEMPEYSGLQLLEFFNAEEINFEIIFTTAYSEYAIKAFELNAISYLLKPLRPDALVESVERAIKSVNRNQIAKKLTELKASFEAATFTKIGLPITDGIVFIEFDDLIICKADGMYTKVFTRNDGELLISKPLKYILDLLEGNSQFFRPHRSYLINLKYIKQFVKSDGNYILMDNGESASLSKEKKEEFLAITQ